MEQGTLESNYRELKQIAAQMYEMVYDTFDIGDCLNPNGDDESCVGDCSDCGYYSSELREKLLRLGVDI